MIDAIDMTNLLNNIIQPNIKFLLIALVIIVLAFRNLETNVISIISIIIFI